MAENGVTNKANESRKQLNVNLLLFVVMASGLANLRYMFVFVSIKIVYRINFMQLLFRICTCNCPSLKCNYLWFVDYFITHRLTWAILVLCDHYQCGLIFLCFHRIECYYVTWGLWAQSAYYYRLKQRLSI